MAENLRSEIADPSLVGFNFPLPAKRESSMSSPSSPEEIQAFFEDLFR